MQWLKNLRHFRSRNGGIGGVRGAQSKTLILRKNYLFICVQFPFTFVRRNACHSLVILTLTHSRSRFAVDLSFLIRPSKNLKWNSVFLLILIPVRVKKQTHFKRFYWEIIRQRFIYAMKSSTLFIMMKRPSVKVRTDTITKNHKEIQHFRSNFCLNQHYHYHYHHWDFEIS